MALAPLLAAALSAAVPPAAAPPAAPVDEGQVDRLLLALPRAAAKQQEAEEAAELARLTALNPGRGDAIKAILDSYLECARGEERRSFHAILAAVAAQMGPDKTERMIAFYASPEHASILDLFLREGAGPPLSAKEKRELDRAEAAYPIREYALTMQAKVRESLAAGRAMPDYARCGVEWNEALGRAGLRRR